MTIQALDIPSDREKAVDALEEFRLEATTKEHPQKLPLTQIAIKPVVFQARIEELSEKQLSNLSKALKNAEELELNRRNSDCRSVCADRWSPPARSLQSR